MPRLLDVSSGLWQSTACKGCLTAAPPVDFPSEGSASRFSQKPLLLMHHEAMENHTTDQSYWQGAEGTWREGVLDGESSQR